MVFAFIGRVVFASFFIIAGWHAIQDKTNGVDHFLSTYKTHRALLITRFGSRVEDHAPLEWVQHNKEVLYLIVAGSYILFGGLTALGSSYAPIFLAIFTFIKIDIHHNPFVHSTVNAIIADLASWILDLILIGIAICIFGT